MVGIGPGYVPPLPASAVGPLALAWARLLRADARACDPAAELALPELARREGLAPGVDGVMRWRRYILPDGSRLRVSVGAIFGRRAFRLGWLAADD